MTSSSTNSEEVVGHLENAQRQNHRPKHSRIVSASIVAVALAFLLLGTCWATEKLSRGVFKSPDEAVDWLKARGKCDGPIDIVSCRAEIQLPAKDREGKEISPGWRVEAFWKLIETKGYRNLFAHIVRSRIFSLSPTDPLATVMVENGSFHEFGSDGVIYGSRSKVVMTSYKGENILNLTIPWTREVVPVESIVEDLFLLHEAFGVGWKFLKTSRD